MWKHQTAKHLHELPERNADIRLAKDKGKQAFLDVKGEELLFISPVGSLTTTLCQMHLQYIACC